MRRMLKRTAEERTALTDLATHTARGRVRERVAGSHTVARSKLPHAVALHGLLTGYGPADC